MLLVCVERICDFVGVCLICRWTVLGCVWEVWVSFWYVLGKVCAMFGMHLGCVELCLVCI